LKWLSLYGQSQVCDAIARILLFDWNENIQLLSWEKIYDTHCRGTVLNVHDYETKGDLGLETRYRVWMWWYAVNVMCSIYSNGLLIAFLSMCNGQKENFQFSCLCKVILYIYISSGKSLLKRILLQILNFFIEN